MKKLTTKYIVYTGLAMLLLIASGFVKANLVNSEKIKTSLDSELKNKIVVDLWLRADTDTLTRRFQVERYNKENKDNIYINYEYPNEDYYNLLKTSLATKKKPDIFQYGDYRLLKDDKLMKLDDLKFDISSIGTNNIMYYNKEPMGVKIFGSSVKLVWNKEIFKESGLDPNSPPRTWNELINMSEKIKAAHPDIVPFEFPLQNYSDFKVIIGESSVNSGSIYTTFWDYKSGKYDFSYSKNILSVLNTMYNRELLNEDFYKEDKNKVRDNFYRRKSAMIISTFEDKQYFSSVIPLKFNIGITDIPARDSIHNQNYYFVDKFKYIVINKESENKDAVLKVLNWLSSEELNEELVDAGHTLTTLTEDNKSKESLFKEYNIIDNFKYETFDPTMFISYNEKDTLNTVYEAIKGVKSIDEAIRILNNSYENYCKVSKESAGFDFTKYIDN